MLAVKLLDRILHFFGYMLANTLKDELTSIMAIKHCIMCVYYLLHVNVWVRIQLADQCFGHRTK